MKPSDLKRLYSNVKPSTDLDQQVLSDIDCLRASMPSHVTPHRALVPAIACAVCLLVAALYLSTGAAPDGNDAAIHSAVSNAFNLEVAEANDSTGSTEIAASPSGLMPVNEGVDAAHLELMLNLDVRGANVSSVTYRMAASPTRTIRTTGERRGDEEPIQSYDTVRIVASDPQEGVGQSSSDGDSYTINYQQGSGVGTYQTADGLYPTLAVYARSAEFWSSDPTLALLHKWVATGTTFDEFDTDPSHTTDSSTQRPDETDEEYRARQQDSLQTVIAASDQAASEYHESFDERAASSQSFRAWMKSLYIKNFEFCAEELAACRLEATVSFADGSTETHLYRISLVSSYEEVLSDRFDALCGLDGDFSRQLAGKLPWKSWATPTDEQIANDDRLSVPIFSIEEVSE